MSFPYKKVLVVGATSGIGAALASKFIAEGAHCIVVGRRTAELEAFVQVHDSGRADAMTFDISNLSAIPKWAESVTTKHPDLDCVFLNSGVQRSFDFSKPDTVDLDTLSMELTTNYLAYMYLIKAFLPHLQQSKAAHRALVFTSSGLGLVPMVRCPNYSATKAALHHFALALREQVKGQGIKVLEIIPPAVQTELHDAKHQPDIKDGAKIGMPLSVFVEEAYDGLVKGQNDIPVGDAKGWYNAFEPARQKEFAALNERMKNYGK